MFDGYIPFSVNGNLLNYTIRKYPDTDTGRITWKYNYKFKDRLRIVSLERGRSAAHFIVESLTTNKRYVLFMSDLLDIIKNNIVDHGVIEGNFTFTKKGQNYGVTISSGPG